MGFNYGYEKKKFDSRWKRLEVEYCDAGMSEEQIAAMKEYDWAWFCSQRVFQNHTQPIPCEQYDEVCGQSQLFRKFASLSYQWDVDTLTVRAARSRPRPAVSATCVVILALVKSFLPHGLSIVGSIRPTSSKRSLMKWSTACGRKTDCFSAGTA